MPTKSPLLVLAAKKPPLPKLAGPVKSTVPVYLTRARPCARPRHYIRRISSDPRCGTKGAHESQSGQVNGSASSRHNVGPDLLQRYGVSLGRLDGQERRCDEEHQ